VAAPPGVFELPWLKCHGGLGVATGSSATCSSFRLLVHERVPLRELVAGRCSEDEPWQRASSVLELPWQAVGGGGDFRPGKFLGWPQIERCFRGKISGVML
jgi:hypothetical protein